MLEAASVETFLKDCLEVSRSKQSPQIASITLPFHQIDFIANIPDGFHCYIEKPKTTEAVLAISTIIEAEYSGKNRFQHSKAFCEEVINNTHCYSENIAQAPSDFRIFSGFTFFPDTTCEFSPFKPATAFVPQLQITQKQNLYALTINLFIDPAYTDRKLYDIYQDTITKTKNFKTTPSPASNKTSAITAKLIGDLNTFEKNAYVALQNIKANKYKKIVLAQALDLTNSVNAFNLRSTLEKLKQDYSNCFIFSLNAGRSSTFIGASPERIFKKDRFAIETEAIAGSKPRSQDTNKDDLLGKELINSPKERLEQDLIIESLVEKLKALGLQPYYKKEPSILKLSTLQHLYTSIVAELNSPLHPLDILEILHPTPAVGGMPFEAAQEDIQKLEPFDRNLYAGPIGWLNPRGESEFIVGIRSGVVDGNRARIYAGAGIVESSTPNSELEEIELKLDSIKANFV